MTPITSDRVLSRETASLERRRPIIIELHPRELVLRLKGTRRRHAVPWDAIYWMAVKAEAEAARRERAAKKKKGK